MGGFNRILRNIDRERMRAQRKLGIPTTSRELAARVVGGRNLPLLGFGKTKTLVPNFDPTEDALPQGGLNPSRCAIDPFTGQSTGRKPFAFNGSVVVTAGALAIDTDLADFYAAAAVDFITADNVVPFGVSVSEARLYITLNESVAAAVADVAKLAGLYIIERENGIEVARYPITDFDPVIENKGVGTSGNAIIQVSGGGVPFRRDYDPDKTYAMVLRTTKAFTPVGNIDATLVLKAVR